MHAIHPEGFGAIQEKPADVFDAEVLKARISQATTLADIVKDFTLFSTSILHTHGQLDKDPVHEFVNESPGKPVLTAVRLDQPIFRNLFYPWDRLLFAVDNDHWDECFRFLAVITIKNTPKKVLHRALPHDVEVPDLLALAKMSSLPARIPMVPVTIFGLDGNQRQVAIVPCADDPQRRPRLVTMPPRPETIEFAKNLFAERSPFQTDAKDVLASMAKKEGQEDGSQ